MRSLRDFLLRRKPPRRDFPQMWVKPRKLKVSGLEIADGDRDAVGAYAPAAPYFAKQVFLGNHLATAAAQNLQDARRPILKRLGAIAAAQRAGGRVERPGSDCVHA
jgi:hypothetical protein